MTIEEIESKILWHQTRIASLQKEMEEMRIAEEKTLALENTYSALFDGVKFTNTVDTAIEVTFPMIYKANLYYKTISTEFDGIKNINIEKVYICMPSEGLPLEGILTEENFETVMVEM